ncbi:MAG: hypothetical protein H7A39_01630 [Chlamydiales bacterium]|nr:hypothetical protein [Chlamydiales bacterium]
MKTTLQAHLTHVSDLAAKPPGKAYGVALAILGVAAAAGGCLLLHRYYWKKTSASASQPGADKPSGGPPPNNPVNVQAAAAHSDLVNTNLPLAELSDQELAFKYAPGNEYEHQDTSGPALDTPANGSASDSPITEQAAAAHSDLEGNDSSFAELSDQELAFKYEPGNEYEPELLERAKSFLEKDNIQFYKICDENGNFVGMRALPGREWTEHTTEFSINKGYLKLVIQESLRVTAIQAEDPQTYLLLLDLHFNESGSFDHFTVKQLIDLFLFNEEKLQNEIDRIHILQLLNNRDISDLLDVDLVAKLYIANQLYGPFNHLFTQLIKFFWGNSLTPFLNALNNDWSEAALINMINHLDSQNIREPEIKSRLICDCINSMNENFSLPIGRLKDHGTRNKISKLQVNGANRGEYPELLDTELAEQYAPNNEYENELNCRIQGEYQPGSGVNKFFKIRNSKDEFVAMRAFQCPIDKKHSFGEHQGLKCYGNGKLFAYFQESLSLQDKYPDAAAYVRYPLVEIRADDPEATLAALDFILGDVPLEGTDASLALRMFLIASKDWGASLQMIEIINYLNNYDLSSILTPDSARQLRKEIKSYLRIGNIDHLLREIANVIGPE